MQIILSRNINLFKNKNDLEYIQKIKYYKKYFKPIFLKWINEVGINTDLIVSIVFVANKSSLGSTIYHIENNIINFSIELTDDIIPYICEKQTKTDEYKAKSIFQHELFHCVEIFNLYTSQKLIGLNPFDNNFQITTTYNYLYYNAINLWSEFFACYNNYKINKWHQIPYLKADFEQLDKWMKAIVISIEKSETKNLKLITDIFDSLHTVWYNMISLMAVYMQNKEPILLKEFQECYSDYTYSQDYFESIYNYLTKLIVSYPNWISENSYIEFGKMLLSVFEMNNITYSTDNLSDNFVFTKKE